MWRRLDEASPAEARRLLGECCGSTRWVDGMLQRRPFNSHQQLLADAREVWWKLEPDDWREAFSHHPRIGDREALRSRFASTRGLSEAEQAGVSAASEQTLEALAEGNQAYERRFGYIFIVCATGKSADEMLALLNARMVNEPAIEIHVAAEEQAKIMAIRLSRE